MSEQAEKARRVYYQHIVYDVCNQLDRELGGTTVCGCAECPATGVQDRLKEVLGKMSNSPSPCEHEWRHMETTRWTESGTYQIQWNRLEKYHCSKCLERKDVKKSEYSRDCPDFYRTSST